MIKTIKLDENFVFMGNKSKTPTKGIDIYRLILNTEHYLNLCDILYVPTFFRNLVSLQKLDLA